MVSIVQNSKLAIFAAAATLALSGCASSAKEEPNFGQRVAERGGAIANYGEQWIAGQQNIKAGEDMVEKGERDLRRAEKRLRDARRDLDRAEKQVADARSAQEAGRRMISQGTAQMSKAEQDYLMINNEPSVLVVPDQ